jgi:putative transcription factor
MCGEFAGPDLMECQVDGAIMMVCPKCAKFGTKVAKKPSGEGRDTEVAFVRNKPGGKGQSVSHVKVKTGSPASSRSHSRRRSRDILRSDEVLIENYGDAIKEARKAKGLSLEDFAQMINEKASLIQKIEKSEFEPSESLLVKIERKLDLVLTEKASAPIYTGTSSTKETTLGDVVKLKKRKK